MSMLGPISTLRRYHDETWEADFMSGVTPPDMIFTRVSTATYWDSQGNLRAAGVNEPRFEYDPLTGEGRGLLAEYAATNRFPSSDFSAAALTNGSTKVSLSWGRGFTVGVRFSRNTSAHQTAYITTPMTAGMQVVVSCFVRMDDGAAPVIGIATGDGDFGMVYAANLIPGNNTNVVDLGGGLYRIWATRSSPSSPTSASAGIVKYSGQSARTFTITGFQIEEGTQASSYIPTTNAAATRGRDTISFPTPWYQNSIGGTLLIEADYIGGSTVSAGIMASIGQFDDGSLTNNRAGFWYGASTRSVLVSVRSANAEILSATKVIPAASPQRIVGGLIFGVGGGLQYVNGVIMNTGPVATLPLGIIRLVLLGYADVSFYFRSVRYYAKRADIATLTKR